MRHLMIITCLLAASTIVPSSGAFAQSCSDLQNMLNQSPVNKVSAQTVKRYSAAIKQQTKLIAKVKTDLKRYRCASKKNTDACRKLNQSQSKMRQNLGQLKQKLNGLKTGGHGLSQRDIRRQYAKQNCGSRSVITLSKSVDVDHLGNGAKIYRAKSTPAHNSPSFASFSNHLTNNMSNDDGVAGSYGQGKKIIAIPSVKRQFGQYRTLCVRTCDGFFFPISSNTNPNSFARDELACQMMCPGVRTELYFHKPAYQESREMMSYRGGQSYANQNFAFQYRNGAPIKDSSCSCNMAAFYDEMARRETLLNQQNASAQPSKTIELDHDFGQLRQSGVPTTHHSTAQRSDGGDIAHPNDPALKGSASGDQLADHQNLPDYDDDQNIRQVGPIFLPN